jgi:hypothetical protein
LIVDARFLKLLGKYPGKEGCIVEAGGGDREIDSITGAVGVDIADEVIDLCGDDDDVELVEANVLKRGNEDEMGDEERRKRVQLSGSIVID